MWKQDTGDVGGYLTSEFRQVLTSHLTKDFYVNIKGGDRPIGSKLL